MSLRWDQMKVLFTDISREEASELARSFSARPSDLVRLLDSTMIYEGFSPRTIATKMQQKHLAMRELIRQDHSKLEIVRWWSIRDASGREQIGEYTNNESLMKDIECICNSMFTLLSLFTKKT